MLLNGIVMGVPVAVRGSAAFNPISELWVGAENVDGFKGMLPGTGDVDDPRKVILSDEVILSVRGK